MHIREIEIDNFKSFANKVNIPFLEGFTTISGPNGSGKSNIIDSVLFALGLSTSRTLRAEKLYHLISTHNKRNEATVKITFSDGDNDNAMTVMRKIRKAPSGFVSNYYLNGKGATLSEIHEVLAKYNISPNSYNVIMQGDVTGITNATPNERRKILDEIAGVADFDRRIEQATHELETVEQRVEKSNIILNEIEIRLAQLESEREHALKYQNLKEQKQKLEAKLSTVKYFDIKTSIERLHESILDANKNKKNEEAQLKELTKTLEETRQKLLEVSELVKVKGEDEQIEIKKQAEGLKGVISRKKDSIQYIDKQVQDNITSVENAKESQQKLKDKIEDAQLRIESKLDEIKIIEKNIQREKEELERVLTEVSQINKTADENIEKRNELRRQLESSQDQENQIIKEKLPLEEKLSRYRRDLEEANKAIEQIQEFKNEFASKKDIYQVQVEELEKELNDYKIVQQNTLYELDKVKNELSDASYNVNLAYKRVTQLEANKKAVEEANFGYAIDTVMNSGLRGIHAPLAQLGKVDKEYATALEIAMGGRMRFIVVDDDEVASNAIEILKSTRAGRATFLPLNKIKSVPNNMKLPKEAGIIDYAINLVEFDEIYRSAFFHALGDTLVVEDMNTARRLAGKYRMVTLDGSLVEKTGSMTGGSIAKSGLKFSQAEDEELKIYKERLEKLEQKVSELEKKKTDLEFKLDKVRIDYSSTMNELNKKKLELESMEKRLQESDKTIEEKQQLIAEYTPEIGNLENLLKELDLKHDVIKSKIESITKQIQVVESEIPKDELSKLNELTESVEFEIRQNQTKIANAQNEIKGIKMEIAFNEQAIVAQEERIEKLLKDNELLLKDKELHKVQIIQTEEKLAELNEKIKEIGSKLVELQKERDELNDQVLSYERRKTTAENKISRIEEQIEAYKARRKELEPQLYTIREELINAGYDIASLQKEEVSTEEVVNGINRLQKRMEEMEPVNMRALTDYEEVLNRKEELRIKLETLITEKNQIIERMQSYEELKKKSFMETFEKVNENFIDIFAQLSDGSGRLILEKPDDPLNGGLTIEAQPRDKKMQRLESMSGGEKSLTALAFVFAIQRYLPAPFYAFDEVDMHLDGINVEKLAEMIRKQSENTQFIVVSLRKPMIESADRTIGVTQKDSGITKVTGVKLTDSNGRDKKDRNTEAVVG